MKVVVFGCQQIAVDFINYLSGRKDVELTLAITYELPLDETYGYDSVLKLCREREINVINPQFVTEDVVRLVRDAGADIIFSIYYRKILPKSLINYPKHGCINIHPSALPYYRGPVPTAWAIENGEEKFGITIHYMDEGIDTGDILVQHIYEIGKDETGYELYTRAMKLGSQLLIENIDNIFCRAIRPMPQKGTGSYYGKKNGKHTIDWRRSVKEIRNMVRVHAKPFNPAETVLFNRYVLINKATEHSLDGFPAQGGGRIISVIENDQLVVSCSDGFLLIEDYEIVPNLTAKERQIYLREGNRFG